MVNKETIFKELVKNGYSAHKDKKVWDIADMSFLYLTPEMAQGFLKLKEHPRYKATIVDIEIKLLQRYASDFLTSVRGSNFNLIDMSCGDGTKAAVFIESLGGNINLRYCPISVNKHLVGLAIKNIKKKNLKNITEYSPRVTQDFFSMEQMVAALRSSDYQKNVILLLESILGGFQINDYLFRISRSMFPGDLVIIGNGIRKGERFVNLETYKHSVFHEWFVHLMKELGFAEHEIEYDARFDNNRVEGFYKIKVDRDIEFGRNKIAFKVGDEIVVAAIYKYYAQELEKFCKMYFPLVKLVKDPEDEYALVFCRK